MYSTYNEIMGQYPNNKYRVSRSYFDANEPQWPGECGGGYMVAGLCFVLLGEVIYKFQDQEIKISAGQHKELPGGEYSLYLGDGDVEIVNVWELLSFVAKSSQV